MRMLLLLLLLLLLVQLPTVLLVHHRELHVEHGLHLHHVIHKVGILQ